MGVRGDGASRQALPRTSVIVHGIEDPLGGRDPLQAAQPLNGKSFAYVGRLVMAKGLSVLLEATRLLRVQGHDVAVLLIGDAPHRPRIDTQINALVLEQTVPITRLRPGPRFAQD